MVKQLGPILVLALLGGTALAQEPSPVTVRPLSEARPGLIIERLIPAGAAMPRQRLPQPQPAPAFTSPVDLLLTLADAF